MWTRTNLLNRVHPDRSLQRSQEQFVDETLARVPPTPPNHDTIVARNKSGQWPGDVDNVIELEAGANCCAVE